MTEVGWELIGRDHATEKGGGEEDRKVPPLNAIALGHEKQDIPYARSVVMMAIGRTRQKLSSIVEMGTNSNTLRCERALRRRPPPPRASSLVVTCVPSLPYREKGPPRLRVWRGGGRREEDRRQFAPRRKDSL